MKRSGWLSRHTPLNPGGWLKRLVGAVSVPFRWTGDFLWAWANLPGPEVDTGRDRWEVEYEAYMWWDIHVLGRLRHFREVLTPNATCEDCGRPLKRWWREAVTAHDSCLPF